MTYTFDNTNIISGYIKGILKDFNLPTCPVYRTGLDIIPGRVYLDENYFISFDVNQNRKNVDRYIFGKHYDNLTKNLVLKSNYYDQYTHEYLGDYLRFMRDYNKLDLMSLYNCYSGYKTKTLKKYIVKTVFRQNEDLDDNGKYLYYVFPVKFNQKYTISLESTIPFDVFLMLNYESPDNESLYKYSKVTYTSCLKKHPKLYKTDIGHKGDRLNGFKSRYSFTNPETNVPCYWSQEENLKMVIKLPAWESTSITVLEGDYTSIGERVGEKFILPEVYNNDEIQLKSTRLSLLENPYNVSLPFADRLVEYLTDLAITTNTKIPRNIGRIQNKVYSKSTFRGYYDIFDLNLKKELFNLAKKSELPLSGNRTLSVDKLTDYKFYSALRTEENIELNTDTADDIKNNGLNLIDRKADLLYFVDKDIEEVVNAL